MAEAAEPSEDSRRSATERFAATAFPTGEVTKTPSATDRFAVAASLTGEDGRKGNADNTGDCKIGEDDEVEVEESEERPRARGEVLSDEEIEDTRAERFRAIGVVSDAMVGGTASVGRTARCWQNSKMLAGQQVVGRTAKCWQDSKMLERHHDDDKDNLQR